jgi:hypothetical protein
VFDCCVALLLYLSGRRGSAGLLNQNICQILAGSFCICNATYKTTRVLQALLSKYTLNFTEMCVKLSLEQNDLFTYKYLFANVVSDGYVFVCLNNQLLCAQFEMIMELHCILLSTKCLYT